MFNLFGSIFFFSKSVVVDTQSTETQTNQIEINGPVENMTQTNTSIQNDNHVCVSNEDWDIVDRTEEADKCESQDSKEIGVNTSICQSLEPNPDDKVKEESIFDRPEDDNDIILGSFFEKNEKSNDDDARYKTQGLPDDDEEITDEVVVEVRNKDWLITPLPCLTSITSSQRSMSENADLENLLIEHPSMSVFVSATSTSIIEIDESNEIVMQSVNVMKTQTEKRKGIEMQVDSQNGTMKRKGKKGKRSNNAVSNKENVRALLLNENKRTSDQARKLDSFSLNGKQMKRNNRNSNNVNMNKRKYHQMQQPAFFNNNL